MSHNRPQRVLDAAADALLFAQTGACHLGRACGLCDCPASYDEAWMRDRDDYAREHAAAAVNAARDALREVSS